MNENKTAPQSGAQSVDNSVSEKNGAPRGVIRIRTWTAQEWFELRAEVLRALQLEYPNVDVPREIAKMILWAESNPARPWLKPMARIHKWLQKEAARAAARGNAPARGTRAARAVKAAGAEWWTTERGWLEKGSELGITLSECQTYAMFKARICIALGDGPWVDDRDWLLVQSIRKLRGEDRPTPPDQARQHLQRLREMGLYSKLH